MFWSERMQEKIYQKIVSLCAHYNGGEDPGIVMRGWDADLKALITQKLSRLGICVLVCAPKRKPLQEPGGPNAVILERSLIGANKTPGEPGV